MTEITALTALTAWAEVDDVSDRLLEKAAALNEIADDLAGEFNLQSTLERILTRCMDLMDCHAGSISSVDEASRTYRKEADVGIHCRSGQVFPLNEGMTGEVVRRRGPVWFDRYDDVPDGHISDLDRRSLRGTIGVPLEWKGRVIGVCVVFSRDSDRRFGAEDARLLSMFARHAALALANAMMYEAVEERARSEAAANERARIIDTVHDALAGGLADLLTSLGETYEAVPELAGDAHAALSRARRAATDTIRSVRQALDEMNGAELDPRSLEEILDAELKWIERARPVSTNLVVSGPRVPLDAELAGHVARIAREAMSNVIEHAAAQSLRVGLVYESAAISLMIQDDGRGFEMSDESRHGLGHQRIVERARELGGVARIESVVGWGTSVRVRVPYQTSATAEIRRLPVIVSAPRLIESAGLGRLLSWADPAIDIVGEAATDMELLHAFQGVMTPDVVLLTRDTPSATIDAVVACVQASPGARILVVAHDPDPDFVSEVVLAGATGCVSDTSDGVALANAVIATANGHTVMPATMMPSRRNNHGLTSRELEVRQLLQRGLSNKAIAERLVISIKTVEKHVGSVLRKAGYATRAELIAEARSTGR